MAVPNIFGTATSAIPLSQLDTNFATAITLGNTAVYLGNTTTSLGNVTLTNVTISSGNVTLTGANVSGTANVSTLVVTGNQTFVGTGNRITGDFTNATPANRVAFQTSTTNSNTGLVVLPNGTATTANIQFFNNSDSTNASGFQIANLSTESTIRSLITGTGTYVPMTFYTGGSERARIDTAGNVGIGTSSPTARLHSYATSGTTTTLGRFEAAIGSYTGTSLIAANTLSASSSYNLFSCITDSDGDAGGPFTEFLVRGDGNVGIGTASPTGKLHVSGFVLSGGQNYSARFSDAVNSTYSITHQSGLTNLITDTAMAFYTANVERMRIDSSGNVLVGTTNSSITAGTGMKFDINGTNPQIAIVGTETTSAQLTYSLYSSGASAYRFYVNYAGTINATSATITAISDQRLKENIRDLDDGLDKILALKPRKFDWKEGKGANIKDARGFIAQEFETVFPDMIEEWKDPAPEGEESYKAVNANLIPSLVKAIQEQQALITALTARITALESN